MKHQSTTEDLLLEMRDRVAILTLNRPDRLNALSSAMMAEGARLIADLGLDPTVGCIALTGSGRGFCAGGDVTTMAAAGEQTFEQRIDGLRAGQELSWRLHHVGKPTLALVNGAAAGAGLGIALSCDLRLASATAKFTTAYAKVGFGGDFGTTWQLTRVVGPAKAKELFFLPDTFTADEALRIGLVNRVLPAEGFLDAALEVATRIANGPAVSYRYMKENVNLSVDSDFRSILDREAMTHLRCGETEDHKEGVSAFLEKREPRFTGR
jgi:2-(1,2-epoxy-1,2-dihydrophenyl)acetyl-CoA isomerase